MVNTKPITILYKNVSYSGPVTSHMDAIFIYEALRAILHHIIGTSHIIIKKSSGELAQLSYPALKAGATYTIALSVDRIRGAGTASSATKRTAQNLVVICSHWGLQDASEIFPAHTEFCEGVSIVPRTRNAGNLLSTMMNDVDTSLLKPALWGRGFTDGLRGLSARTQGRHEEALRLLVGVMSERLDSDKDMVIECVGNQEVNREAVSGLQAMAQQATEELEEVEAKEVFVW
ncbi:hypothetical protein E8E11_006982 [Didymella keratinophila]|nr:hypothetical protein E8E11_006982 [Didymella keratinophila]